MPQEPEIIAAVKAGNTDQVQTLLQAKPDLLQEAKGPDGESLILVAVAAGQKEIAAYLLAQGADINATQTGGYTPLHIAAKNGNEEMIQFLLEHMADINAVTDDGQTAMELAIKHGHDAGKWFIAG